MGDDNGNALDRRRLIGGGIGLAAAPMTPAFAAPATRIAETMLHGRQALTMNNGLLSLSVLPGGGFIGDVRLVSRDPRLDISPMLVHRYPTIDPYTYDPARDDALYGSDVQHHLMAGYMGHFTCFPQFGNSADEFAASGYGQHGEAILAKWERLPGTPPEELAMAAYLPQNQYAFQRAITLLPDETVAYVTETAENLTIYERPLQWVQHVTMGPPFVEVGKTWADASVDSVVVGRGDAARRAAWPQSAGADGAPVDYRATVGSAHTWMMQNAKAQNWFAAYHAGDNVLFGHIYDARINPWVLDWQTDRQSKTKPWNGEVVARGICWGDSPAANGVKNAVQQGRLFGVPTFSWIGGRAKRSQSYAIFMAPLPGGWRGTADVTANAGHIAITERETGRMVMLKAFRL